MMGGGGGGSPPSSGRKQTGVSRCLSHNNNNWGKTKVEGVNSLSDLEQWEKIYCFSNPGNTQSSKQQSPKRKC